MNYIPGIFAMLVMVAGWHYAFHSLAAQKLSGVEDQRLNLLRVRLRRGGGGMMFALAITFYTLCYADVSPLTNLLLMLALMLLMLGILVLGWIDLHLTRRLRNNLRNRKT